MSAFLCLNVVTALHALSNTLDSYEGLVKLGYCTWVGHTVSAAPATATQVVLIKMGKNDINFDTVVVIQ